MSQLTTAQPQTGEEAQHWTARHGKPIIFVILTLVAVGVYLAASIPVAVFPRTHFPRLRGGAPVGGFSLLPMRVKVTPPPEVRLNNRPRFCHLNSTATRARAGN